MHVQPLDCILVYHWQAWEDFYISHLVDPSCQIRADYTDDFQGIVQHIRPNIRAVLFQINLSRADLFPERRSQIVEMLQRRGLVVLNTEVQDITKHNLHRMLKRAGLRSLKATRSGPAEEILFLKTNLNFGGMIEQRMPQSLRRIFLPEPPCPISRWDEYHVAMRCNVPKAYWSDPSIIIERYIDNPEDSFFRVYGFGDAIVVVKGLAKPLVKKLTGRRDEQNFLLTRRQLLSQKTILPRDLQGVLKRFIAHYPLAYFCLDLVHDGQRHYIIDLNLTPYSDPRRQTREIREFLTHGAEQFVLRAANRLQSRK
jgi:hypothetical protein